MHSKWVRVVKSSYPFFFKENIVQVIVKYHDKDSFLIEEVIKQARNNYGTQVVVEIQPDSNTPIDYLYFAIQRLITGDHITLLFDSGSMYKKDLEKLRAEIMYKVGEVVDDVILENEARINQED